MRRTETETGRDTAAEAGAETGKREEEIVVTREDQTETETVEEIVTETGKKMTEERARKEEAEMKFPLKKQNLETILDQKAYHIEFDNFQNFRRTVLKHFRNE